MEWRNVGNVWNGVLWVMFWVMASQPQPAWRAELERVGEDRDRVNRSGKTKRQPAFRWLGDEAEVQRLREESAHHYLRWTVLALIAAMIVGLIAFGLTFLH